MKNKLYMTFSFRHFLIAVFIVMSAISVAVFFSIERQSISAVSFGTDERKPLIIIDAGHGGEDGGTQSSSGILEKDINLMISKKLNLIFKSMGYEALMIREEDKMIYGDDCNSQREKKVSDIHNRMDLIDAHPDSVFLSIHQNHYTESKYNGAQVFYSPNNAESEFIAEAIQSSIISLIQNENTRKIKQSGTEIYLLYHAQSPAVMVECGFLSNPGEALLLNDGEYQKKMCFAIVKGINDYCNKG